MSSVAVVDDFYLLTLNCFEDTVLFGAGRAILEIRLRGGLAVTVLWNPSISFRVTGVRIISMNITFSY